MPVVDVIILGHMHRLTCKVGEEERLKYLAEKFKNRVETASKGLPTADHRLVYLIASLTLMDEMEEKASTSNANEAEAAMKLIHDKVLSIKEELA